MTLAERFQEIPIEDIVASKTNPRTHFDDSYIDELARSIAEKGLIQPIVVRPNGSPATFEIVAGECRYRASKRANLPHVPAIIREYTDEQALEVQLIENIHRTDLTPLERARGYRRLINTNPTKHSAETIAARVGMSPAWVWDTMKLLDLIPEAQQLLEDDRISAGHAILIARFKPEQQARILSTEDPLAGGLFEDEQGGLYADDPPEGAPWHHGFKPRSVRELAKWIADHIRFDVAHAAQAAPLVFEPLAQRVEEAASKPGKGKRVIAITYSHHVQPEAKDANERTYGPQSWKRADGTTGVDEWNDKPVTYPTCELSVLGVVAAGDHYGEAFDVCIAREKCTVHWKQEIQEKRKTQELREKGETEAASKREAATQARERREQEERTRLEMRWKAYKPALAKAVLAAAGKAPQALPKPVLQKVLTHYRLPATTTPAQLQKAMLLHALQDIFDRGWSHYSDEPRMTPWAKLLDIDLKALEPKAAVQTSGAAAKKPGPKASKKGRR